MQGAAHMSALANADQRSPGRFRYIAAISVVEPYRSERRSPFDAGSRDRFVTMTTQSALSGERAVRGKKKQNVPVANRYATRRGVDADVASAPGPARSRTGIP